MVRGEEVTYGEIPAPVKFPWAVGHEMPSWIAAYGPLALKTAGEHADGVVLQIADPGLCKWFTDQCIDDSPRCGELFVKDLASGQSRNLTPRFDGSIPDNFTVLPSGDLVMPIATPSAISASRARPAKILRDVRNAFTKPLRWRRRGSGGGACRLVGRIGRAMLVRSG